MAFPNNGALQLSSSAGAIFPAMPTMAVPAPTVRLDRTNFILWRALILPNFAGAGLHGYLDGTVAAPPRTLTEGQGDAARIVPNPAYTAWWTQDQRVLGLLLGAMEPSIAAQLTRHQTAAGVWTAVHTMYGAQNRANVRHVRRQLQSLRKNDASASSYMDKIKELADMMSAAGSPLSDDELVDQMLTGLGPEFNPVAAALGVNNAAMPLAEFYSLVLSYESLMAGQTQTDASWTSSANAAMRPGQFGTTDPFGGRSGGARPAQGGQQQQGYGGQDRAPSAPYGGQGGQGNGRPPANYNSGGNGRSGKRQRPKCQLCKNWGHEADQCKRYFLQQEYNARGPRSGNAASTNSGGNGVHEHWHMDTGATDNLTSELERLQVHERYGGKDQVQVANGVGLSISHVGHSTLAGSSLKLNNILHVPHISKHLLSVYRLVSDNDVFVEFHRHFFCVKDKATKRILLSGRSSGGLYPIPFSHVSSSPSHASSSVRVSSSQWHQRLGHPSATVVQNIVKKHELPCLSSSNSASVCDACQCAKSHQLSYSASSRVSTMPLELIHSDVWGPALGSSGGFKYYVSFVDDFSRYSWIYLLKHKSDVEEVFYAFQAHVERLLDYKIKAVQSDWGGGVSIIG